MTEIKNKTPEEPSGPSPESSGMQDMDTMHRQMFSSPSDQQAPLELPVPVVQFKPNRYGIRGLVENVSEWGVISGTGSPQKDEKSPYVILPPMIPRQPWEAFEEVGFRTVMSITKQEN